MADHDDYKDNSLKISLLLWLILYVLCGQFTAIGDLQSKHKALLAVSFFGIFGTFMIFTQMLQTALMFKFKKLYLRTETKEDFIIDLSARIFTTFASVCYYVGDNLSALTRTYGTQLGCDSDCQTTYDSMSTGFLLTGVIGFTVLPIYIDKSKSIVATVKGEKSKKWYWLFWRNTEHVMSLIVDLDGWFTTIADLPLKSPKYCPEGEWITSWAFYGIILILWMIVLSLTYYPGSYILVKKKQSYRKTKIFGLIMTPVMLWLCVAGFLLSDNDQPTGCLFDCDVSSDETTEAEHTCQNTSYRTMRAVILIVVEIIFVLLTLGIWIDRLHLLYYSTLYSTATNRCTHEQ